MESLPQNPEFRINRENFHPWDSQDCTDTPADLSLSWDHRSFC